MDLGTTPVDADDIIQRYGRRLFVLAYHLTGDGPRAHELAQECLVRSLLEPAFPAGDRESAIHLIRGLVSLWRERLDPPARSGRPRGKVAAAPALPSSEHAALWSALSRLDPTSRAVLVLRVAGDLEYEAIGRILDMAADIVYARLLQARSRLRPGESVLAEPVFEAMNLYLDGRLAGAERSEFERRLLTDATLRLRVEFHRGLTLELHEDAPPLPRDFAARIHDQLDRTRETLALVDQAVESAGWDPAVGPPAPEAPARGSWWGWAGAIAALLVAVAGITFWVARRLPATAPAASSGATPSATPDEATIQALRSLGYLAPAPGKKGSKPAADPARRESRPAKTPPVAAATPKPQAKPTVAQPSATPAEPEPTPSPTPEPTPEPAQAEPEAQNEVRWRALSTNLSHGSAGGNRVIRTAAEWSALFEGSGAPAPEVAFDRDMAILLSPGLEVVAVRRTAEALVLECRRIPSSPDTEGAAAPEAAPAIILPLSDLPVRVVIR